jgi:hypothetical protein
MSFEVTCLFERYFTLQAFERFLYLFEKFWASLCGAPLEQGVIGDNTGVGLLGYGWG